MQPRLCFIVLIYICICRVRVNKGIGMFVAVHFRRPPSANANLLSVDDFDRLTWANLTD